MKFDPTSTWLRCGLLNQIQGFTISSIAGSLLSKVSRLALGHLLYPIKFVQKALSWEKNLRYIIIIISFVQGIYTNFPGTNYVPRECSVAAILLLLFMVLISLVSVLNLLYFSLTSWFPGMLLTYFLNVFEIVPVAPILLLLLLLLFQPVPVATRSKAWVCGHSPAEIVGFESRRWHGCL